MALLCNICQILRGKKFNSETPNLSAPEKEQILRALWPHCGITVPNGSFRDEDYRAIFNDFRDEFYVLEQQHWKFAAQTQKSTLSLVGDLRQHLAIPREEIPDLLANDSFHAVEHSKVLRSIEMVM